MRLWLNKVPLAARRVTNYRENLAKEERRCTTRTGDDVNWKNSKQVTVFEQPSTERNLQKRSPPASARTTAGIAPNRNKNCSEPERPEQPLRRTTSKRPAEAPNSDLPAQAVNEGRVTDRDEAPRAKAAVQHWSETALARDDEKAGQFLETSDQPSKIWSRSRIHRGKTGCPLTTPNGAGRRRGKTRRSDGKT